MVLHNAQVTGSLTLNNVNISGVTGSAAASASFASQIASLNAYTASANASFSSIETATASLNAFSGSILSYTASANARLLSIETATGSLNTYTGSNNATIASISANIASLSAGSASAAVTVNAVSQSVVSLNVYTASNNANIISLFAGSASAAVTVNSVSQSTVANTAAISILASVTGSYATTGSNTFVAPQFINQASNAISFTSTASLYTDGGARVGKDLFVSGTTYVNNLTVYGTSSIQYITSSQVNIGTNIITVNTDTPAVRFGGLAVFDSGSTGLTGSMLWDSETNHWVYSNPSGSTYSGGMIMSGPRSSALGSEQGTTNNALMKGQGGDHITSSQVIDDGTTVRIPGALQVTGSLVGSSTIDGTIINSTSNAFRFSGNNAISLVSLNSQSVVKINAAGYWGTQLVGANDQGILINNIGQVGIGTTSPGVKLQVDDSKSNTTISAPFNSDIIRLNNTNATTNALHGILLTRTNGASLTSVGAIMSQVTTQTVGNVAADLLFYTTISDVIAEKMRLNASGNLTVGSTDAGNAGTINVSVGVAGTTAGGLQLWAANNQTHYVQFGDGTTGAQPYTGYVGYAHSSDSLIFGTAAATKMTLNTSGNLGLGVTPSAWSAAYVALQIGGVGSLSTTTGGATFTHLTNGAHFNGTNWIYTYTSVGVARYTLTDSGGGTHQWFTSPNSGTAGGTISFTQAMTLNASGNLSIGNTNNTYKLDVTGTARFTGQVTSEDSFYAVATPPATNGGLVNVRDTVTATNVTSFAGVFFNSAPGSDYSIGKLTENNAGFLQIRNGNNGNELLRINSTGVATFASSVNALQFTATDGYGLNVGNFQVGAITSNRFYIYNNTLGIDNISIVPSTGITTFARGISGTTATFNSNVGASTFNWNSGIGALSWSSGYVTMETNSATDIALVTNSVRRLNITSGGNIGIGTTSPSRALTVASDTSFYNGASGAGAIDPGAQEVLTTGFNVVGQSSLDISNIDITLNKWKAIVRGGFANNNEGGGLVSSGLEIEVDSNSPSIPVGSSSITFSRNSSTGKLQVTCNLPSNLRITFVGTIQIINYPQSAPPTISKIILGSVGIGTTNPLSRLHVQASEPNIRIVDTDDSGVMFIGNSGGYSYIRPFSRDFRFLNAAGSSLMAIASGGNVGIGTTSPGEKLEVDGTIKATQLSLGDSYNNTITTDSSWSSFQTVIPTNTLEVFTVYLITASYSVAAAPYNVVTSFTFVVPNGNGGGVDNEFLPICATHQGGTGTMSFRAVAGSSQQSCGLQIKFTGFSTLTGSLKLRATILKRNIG